MPSDPGPATQPEAPVEVAFKPTRTALLADLLVSLFSSAASMRAFVRKYEGMEKLDGDLPGEMVPAATMANALVTRLQEEGLVTGEFFAVLIRVRSFKAREIQEVASAWGIKLETQSKEREPRSRRRNDFQFLLVPLVGICILGVVFLFNGLRKFSFLDGRIIEFEYKVEVMKASVPEILPTIEARVPLPDPPKETVTEKPEIYLGGPHPTLKLRQIEARLIAGEVLREKLQESMQATLQTNRDAAQSYSVMIRGQWDANICLGDNSIWYSHLSDGYLSGNTLTQFIAEVPPSFRTTEVVCTKERLEVRTSSEGKVVVE